jgi:hypothetical protein
LHLLDRVYRVALTAWLQAPERIIHLECGVAVIVIRVDNHLALCLVPVTNLFLSLPISFFQHLPVPFLSETHGLLGMMLIPGSWLFAEFWGLPDALGDFLSSRSFDLMLPILKVVRGSVLHGELESSLRIQIP